MAAPREPHDPAGQVALVEGVARQHKTGAAGRQVIVVQHVGADGPHRDPVGRGVHLDRRGGQRVDVVRGHGRRPGQGRRDGHKPGARGDVDHVPAAHDPRMVEQVAGQRLPAGPGERPERRVQAALPVGLLGALPQADRITRLVQPDLGHQRHRPQPGSGPDDRRRRRVRPGPGGHHGPPGQGGGRRRGSNTAPFGIVKRLTGPNGPWCPHPGRREPPRRHPGSAMAAGRAG